ncbi:hypothetical protein [Photobacterium rosenbergii]|uniref:Uncharacterized protein n=1 Tax=Photobacterium rosenbergii TaxID=294936 RepID=A0ABU3ZIQ0_9GAMM|nr:hypothetical protein [Photobacterium rosenbergii]MDV5169854.1 hypothetical protein [Photobacterium rosenbergii]
MKRMMPNLAIYPAIHSDTLKLSQISREKNMPGNNKFRQRIKTTIYLTSNRNYFFEKDIKSPYSITSMRYKGMEVKITNKEK